MSERWPGGIVRAIPVTPTGPAAYGSAPGVWTLDQAAYWQKQGLWPNANIVPDPYFNYVSLLLSSTALGNANNNLFVDSSGAFNPVSRFGNTTQGSFTPYSANWSNYFDGSGDYLTVSNNAAFGMGTGDFTIECWVNPTAFTGSGNVLVDMRSGTEPSVRPDLEYNSSGVLNYRVNGSTVISGGTLVIGTWSHVALARSGTTTKLFLNGVQVGSSYTDSNNYGSSAACRIGADDDGSPNAYVNGYMSNVRVVKGTAVYTSNFTVPTSPLTAISGTSLLTCQSNRFRDASTNNFTITVSGNTSVQDFNPFLSSTYTGITYNQSDITNWSGFFNGGTDRLQVPVTSNMYLGTTYTIEAWAYYNSASYGARPIFNQMEPFQGGFAFLGFGLNTSGQLVAEYRPATSGAVTTITGPTITPYTWFHIALVCDNSSAKLYINGTQVGSTATFGDYPSAKTNTVAVGSWGSGWNDGGIPAAAWIGYISNVRVVKGVAVYTGNFTPSTTPLTAISGTVLLTCQNAAFTDNSSVNNILTPVSNATVTGNSPFNTVGYWSNYFDGTGDYLTVPYSTALQFPGDFTVECWVYPISKAQAYPCIVNNYSTYTSNGGFAIFAGHNSSGATSKFNVAFNGSFPVINSTTDIAYNAWQHLALVRSGSTITLYVNGVANGTATSSATVTGTANSWWIGTAGDAVSSGEFNGYISNLRAVKGTAVYTGAFTPSTTPLTAISGTGLLTCQNGRFIDNSTNAATVTPAGNASTQSFDPFYTATIASNGGSIFADGTGDYLTIPSSPTIAPLSSAFTWECWFYPNSFVGNTGDGDTLWITSGSGGLQIGCDANTANWGVARNGIAWVLQTSTFPTNKMWNHIAIVRSGTGTNQAAIFLNGTRVVQGTLSSSFPAGSTNVLSANGGAGNSIDGYVSNMRLVVGTAIYDPSVSTCTVPTAPSNPTPATGLLLNGMNAGIYDGTTINDMETVGNAQVSTVQSKFGGSSVYFDGNGDNLFMPSSPSMNCGTANWTVEGWVYTSTRTTNYPLIFGNNRGSFTTDALAITASNADSASYNDKFVFAWGSSGFSSPSAGNSFLLVSNVTNSNGVWYHLAIVRNGTSIKMYRNGTEVASATVSSGATFNWGYNGSLAGGGNWDGAQGNWNGYLDDLRITNGVARYTSSFTPPTQAFPVY